MLERAQGHTLPGVGCGADVDVIGVPTYVTG